MAKIDEKSTIPVSWVAIMLVTFAGILITGTSWVWGVDNRLGRIEEALGLLPMKKNGLMNSANALEANNEPDSSQKTVQSRRNFR